MISPAIIFLGVITLIVIIITVIGMTLPAKVELKEKIIVPVDPTTVFPHLGNFELFVQWSPWTEKDPEMKMKFIGEPISVCSRYEWKGNKKVGKGSMEITHIDANERIEIDLNFGRGGISKTGFLLTEVPNGTQITWFFSTDMGMNPVARIMGPMMKKFIQKDFSKGLENLQKQLSSK